MDERFMRQIFLDTETTGLRPEDGHRIVEIGCVEMVNRRLTGKNYHYYLNPQRPCDPEAARVHGLTDEFLATQPLFADVVHELMAYLAGAELIIHNAPFDVGFIQHELKRVEQYQNMALADHVSVITDSVRMARDRYPGKQNSLDALCRRLEVDNSNRTLHGALLDAGLLAEVYLRMTRGQDSLVISTETAEFHARTQGGRVDFSTTIIPQVVLAPEDLKAHERVLSEIDKASGCKTLWRELQAKAAASF
jgi:DNA polymerase-3 subunit epsilon